MPYVQVPDPRLNAGKPGLSADWVQIRDNQDFFNTQINDLLVSIGISGQSIADDFASAAGTTGVSGATWTASTFGTGNLPAVVSEHSMELDSVGNTAGNRSTVIAVDAKIRIQKAEEYVAIMECRVKGISVSDDFFFIGWQDVALAASAVADNRTDCIAIINGSGGTGWRAITAETAGGSDTSPADFGTFANWHVIRLVVTCSATAGNRKVESYLDGVLQDTFVTDANIPAEILRPAIGVEADGTGVARHLHVDYAIFTFQSRPLAA